MLSTQDQLLGRFYTPEPLARLVLQIALSGAPPRPRLWDPTCGDGSFLRLAPETAERVGTDVDGDAVRQLSERLPEASVNQRDLFALHPDELGTFNVIVGNPPYLRAERVPATDRRRIRERVASALGIPVPGNVDVSLLALVWCSRFLRPGGRLAFVLPATVLDVASGHPLRQWLRKRFAVRLIFDSRVEAWFQSAAVNTVVVVVDSTTPVETRFARLDVPVSPSLSTPLLEGHLGTRGGSRLVPGTRLDAERWSPLLRAPAVWDVLLEAAGDRLTPLGERLELAYGTKPGISGFFAPRPPPPVEPEVLVPFLRSLRTHARYRVRPQHTRDRLFVIPPELDPLPSRAAAWIAAGEARVTRGGLPYPKAPSVQGNRPWWRLPAPRSGPVLVPQFRATRHHIIDNPDHIPVNNSAWFGRWRDPDHGAVGIALVNSSPVALAAEVLGRTNLGEGLLTLYGPELRALPVPDPARFVTPRSAASVLGPWSAMVKRPALPFPEEAQQEDRHALDRAVLKGLGLDPTLGATIREATTDLLTVRGVLARHRRTR